MWLMFFLLLCGILAEVLQPGTLKLAFRTTFTRLERTFGDRANNFMSSLLLNVFRIGTLAMSLYVFTYHALSFSLLTYTYIVLLIIAIVLVKNLLVWLVSYTFEMRRATMTFLPQYDNLWTIFCLVLYPINLLYINVLQGAAFFWVFMAIVIVFVLLMMFKFLQNFYTGLQSLPYLFLYMLTLELVPLGAILLSANYIS